MADTPFTTNQPAQINGLDGYTVKPIFTVGETIGNYVPPGILDGIGAFSLNETTVRFYVNHELGSAVGYAYTLANGTSLTGARVSYFDVDKQTLQIVNSGLAFDTIVNRAGNVVSSSAIFSSTNPNGLDTPGGLSRFCSASLFEAHQFGAGNGLADRIYFANEESGTATNDASQYALDVQTNTLYAVPWLGHAGYENVAEINTGTTNKVAFVIGDDRSAVPMLLYVGDKNAKGDGSFLDRNGFSQGKLYVWVADDPTDPNDAIQADPRDFQGTNNATNGRFVEIDYYNPNLAGNGDYDAQGFATQAKQDSLAAEVNAFLFARMEDVSTNPQDGTQFAANATGRDSIFDGADSWGTVYKFDIDFNNIENGDISANINILYDGDDADKQDLGLRSPDNLDWADDGKIYLQEDRSISSFGTISGQEASIFTLDPSVANPSSTLNRVAQVNRTALPTGQTDPVPTEIGNWETSGILDVSTLFGNQPGQMLVVAVQAHSLRDGAIAANNLVEGGQLVFLVAPAIELKAIGTYATGQYDESAAEIPAYDPVTQRLFVVNAQSGKVDVLDASNPTNPTLITSIDVSAFGLPNSVAIKDGLIAIAVENADKQANGQVLFYATNSQDFATPLKALEVGALPDMLTFSPDGKKVLVANEGEPNEDYTIDPVGSVSIIDLSLGINSATVQTADFTAFNSQFDQLKEAGVKFKGDVGTNRTVAQDLEPEYIAISPDGTKAWVTLQEANAIAIIDIATATVESVKPLGFKNYSQTNNALDASDRDDTINIQSWPIFGMYQPDAIASYTANNQTYYTTANEGDAREYGDYVEGVRIKDLTLDPTAFPDAADLQTDSQLGRLLVTTEMGDTDGDGDYDQLYTFGGRSLSIWDNQGQLVYDSGDDLERITAERYPEYFNASHTNNTLDNRSDDKGPEPEGVVTGEINGRTYAFVGLERIGGVMVYDVTDPSSPDFVQYINNRDFTAATDTAAAKDLGPEGLAFISAQDSPNGKPMLVVANEISGSTTFYEIDLKETPIDNPPQDISDRVTQFTGTGDNFGSLVYNLNDVASEVTTQADNTALDQTDALFHNLVGLYQVENASGAILDTLDLNANGAFDDLLNPNDVGYARTAITNAVNNFVLQLGANGDATQNTNASEFGDVLLQGGKLYSPFAIANGGDLIPTGGTLQDGIDSFLTQNPNNTAANLSDFMTHAVAYFSFGMANSDGAEHLQNRGNNVFGFEDLPGNLGISDFDFNDSVFKFTFTG